MRQHFTTVPFFNSRQRPALESCSPAHLLTHPSLPDVATPTIWGYDGPGVVDERAVDFRVSGFGSTTAYRLLMPGEFFTMRLGSAGTGDEGFVAGEISP